MRYRPLGSSGIKASVVGIGLGSIDEQETTGVIRTAVTSGINLVDTAASYNLGLSESIVGKAIAGIRDKVVISTKCGVVAHTTKGKYSHTQDGKPMHFYLGAESIRYELEGSLKRLGIDYVDLYLTHWQDITTPIEETMGALMELKKEGKIRAIGVSNISLRQLQEYWRFGPVDSDQECYSMIHRRIKGDLLPYCRSRGTAMIAYSPLSRGLLSGKTGPDRVFAKDDARNNDPLFSVENRARVAAMLNAMQPIAEAHGITLTQLVIAWLLSQPGLTHAICAARTREQAIKNAGAGDVVLSDDELVNMNATVERHFPLEKRK